MKRRTVWRGLGGLGTGVIIGLSGSLQAGPVSQSPLQVGGGSVPGSLVLTPSVEYPTVVSAANIDGTYSASKTFAGYFDPDKCYRYQYGSADADRYFRPVGLAAGHACSSNWSGNYLNWAATQTIDTFRSALTGGDRFIDTVGLTVLQKARSFQWGFPDRSIASSEAGGATPFSGSGFHTRIRLQERSMLFSQSAEFPGAPVDYQPGVAVDPAKTYKVYVRVQVCASANLLEENCRQYGSNYKPEGLLQQYSKKMRFSVFSYLNNRYGWENRENIKRDGGVLRARQKFVGPVLDTGEDNPDKEWSPVTGIFLENPSPADAADTLLVAPGVPVSRSGVANYINKFGELGAKSYDNVSELYYAATRYLKNQGNVPEWSASPTSNEIDNFPVITSWDDPIRYSCQKNAILGIGDVNTHGDKNLPGGKGTTAEPDLPQLVADDKTVDAEESTRRVGLIEGVTTLFDHNDGGSLYIAGLAYDAHVKDIRPDLPGKQTVSTYWVDVQEGGVLTNRSRNQYWLAAKYGGFTVPKNYVYDRSSPLPIDWWHTNSDILSTGDPRPDNFFTGGDPVTMRESLKKAFALIAADEAKSTGNLSFSSSRVAVGSGVFTATLNPRYWSGDLLMWKASVGTDGAVSYSQAWAAGSKLDALTDAQLGGRNILTVRPATGAPGNSPSIATQGATFTWSDLSAEQRSALAADPNQAQALLKYLRGSRVQEKTSPDDDSAARPYRQRGSRLGDIVNSLPAYSWHDPQPYDSLASSVGNGKTLGSTYLEFLQSDTYQQRVPLVVVGANDGMLHGFDASTVASGSGGEELFAYVPASVFPNLHELADPAYTHRYFVDGTPVIGNAWTGSAWKTLLVGTAGAGGNSVFALDVTDPAHMGRSSVLWEFSHPDMGYTLGKPVLAALRSGKFVVIVTSGAHDPTANHGYVWILDAANGSVLSRVTLAGAGDLGTVTAINTAGGVTANRLYVGDSKGNLWRVDLAGDDGGASAIPPSLNGGPMFRAELADGTMQPITAAVSAALNRKGEVMVLFGTGRFYRVGDNELPALPQKPEVESLYAVFDTGTAVSGRSMLLEQTLDLNPPGLSSNQLESTSLGWYVDLPADGTRVIEKPQILDMQFALFNVITPGGDPCDGGISHGSIAADLYSGGQLNYALFDSDGDGVPDTNVIMDRSSGTGIQSGDGGDIYTNELGPDGLPIAKKVKLPYDAGRKGWQEPR